MLPAGILPRGGETQHQKCMLGSSPVHVSRFVHQTQVDWPRVPGHGDVLLYITYMFGYTSLPMYVCCACALLTLVVWLLTASILLGQRQFPDLETGNGVFLTTFLDGGLMFMLMAICFYQAYRREAYSRTAFLQQKLLEIQRTAVVRSQKSANRLLRSMLPDAIIDNLKSVIWQMQDDPKSRPCDDGRWNGV